VTYCNENRRKQIFVWCFSIDLTHDGIEYTRQKIFKLQFFRAKAAAFWQTTDARPPPGAALVF
jgi:hypothetical protein